MNTVIKYNKYPHETTDPIYIQLDDDDFILVDNSISALRNFEKMMSDLTITNVEFVTSTLKIFLGTQTADELLSCDYDIEVYNTIVYNILRSVFPEQEEQPETTNHKHFDCGYDILDDDDWNLLISALAKIYSKDIDYIKGLLPDDFFIYMQEIDAENSKIGNIIYIRTTTDQETIKNLNENQRKIRHEWRKQQYANEELTVEERDNQCKEITNMFKAFIK